MPDAFGIPAFILLHRLTFDRLKRADRGAPPLVLEGQCTLAVDWRSLENGLRGCANNISDQIVSKGRRKQADVRGMNE